MEIVYLVVGVIVGGLLGYLWAARKSVSLRSELQMNQQHAQDLLKAENLNRFCLSVRDQNVSEVLKGKRKKCLLKKAHQSKPERRSKNQTESAELH